MKLLRPPSTNGHMATIETFALPAKPKRRRWIAVVAAVLAVAIVVSSIVLVRARSAAAVTFTTVPVAQQTLVQSVTATGTVNPQNTISVGTQDSGTVSEIAVDYNSHAKKGEVLAKLDPTTFEAALDTQDSVTADHARAHLLAALDTLEGQSFL